MQTHGQKLLEVSDGRTSQQQRPFNHDLTAHTLRTRKPQWFPDPRCRTSDRQPTLSGTTTETDEDGHRRRRRQTKTKTNSLWGRAKWQLFYSWRHPRVTNTELDTSPLMRPADSRAHEGCSSLCGPRSSCGTAKVLLFPNLLSVKFELWSVDRPLRLCQLVGLKSSYKTLGTTA